jgi:hypothetical protein
MQTKLPTSSSRPKRFRKMRTFPTPSTSEPRAYDDIRIDLNDSELRIARIAADSVEIVAQSTGFALISERVVLLGDGAIQQFRLQPRQASNQFWNRLSTDPLPVRGPDTANFADLVFRYLSELVALAGIGKSDERTSQCRYDHARTTRPAGGYCSGDRRQHDRARRQRSCGEFALPGNDTAAIHGRVPASRSFDRTVDGKWCHTAARSGFCRTRAWGPPEAWINGIADRFIRDTRFDPLGIASTDQQLYSQLRGWLQQATLTPDVTVEFEHHGTLRRAELTSEALIAKVVPRYERSKNTQANRRCCCRTGRHDCRV